MFTFSSTVQPTKILTGYQISQCISEKYFIFYIVKRQQCNALCLQHYHQYKRLICNNDHRRNYIKHHIKITHLLGTEPSKYPVPFLIISRLWSCATFSPNWTLSTTQLNFFKSNFVSFCLIVWPYLSPDHICHGCTF